VRLVATMSEFQPAASVGHKPTVEHGVTAGFHESDDEHSDHRMSKSGGPSAAVVIDDHAVYTEVCEGLMHSTGWTIVSCTS
jgi:hypothetical protein